MMRGGGLFFAVHIYFRKHQFIQQDHKYTPRWYFHEQATGSCCGGIAFRRFCAPVFVVGSGDVIFSIGKMYLPSAGQIEAESRAAGPKVGSRGEDGYLARVPLPAACGRSEPGFHAVEFYPA